VEGTDIADPVLNWQAGDLELINNGHTIQANVPEGSQSELNGQTYDLIQFHWHRPSEHTVDGDPFAMELHFVHADASGNLAVLGVLLKEGDANPLYDILWEGQPEEGEANTLSDVDFSRLLPGDLTTYVYAGSLTTPPCSEGVAWNVLETPAGISAEQVRAFLYDGNARLVQPVNDRSVEVDED
jgi:carbonic anhydrase